MAVDKSFTELFGAGAAQTITSFTILKASLASSRVPVAFLPLVAAAVNTAESIFLAILLKVWEMQDTSPDAQVAIFGPDVSLVSVVSDGVSSPYQQYVFNVRILTKMTKAMPDPNLV